MADNVLIEVTETIDAVEVAASVVVNEYSVAVTDGATGPQGIQGEQGPIGPAGTTDHDLLLNVRIAASGVTGGHINDQAQSIAGIKTFANGIDTTIATADRIQIDIAATPAASVPGLMQWNATDGTLDIGMPNDVTMQVGQEMFAKVVNRTGSTISNGKAVYFNGRLGNRPTIALAKSDAHATSCVAGLTTQDIEDGDEGYVTIVGYVRQIKTNYAGWTAGARLFISKDTAGELTIVEPVAPHHADVLGTVGIVGAAGIGSILVGIERHFALEDLSDVDGTPLTTSGQIPVWDNTTKYFDFDKNINNYSTIAKVEELQTATKEPTGFTNNSAINVSFNSTTKKITLTGTFKAYWRGVEIAALVNGWVSEAILPGAEIPVAPYYLYYDGTNFIWSTLPWAFDMLQIAYVNYTAAGAFIFAQRECHGFMDHTCHEAFHDNIGTFLESGGDISGVTLNSTTVAFRRPDISATTIKDEDLGSVLAAKTDKLYNRIALTLTGIVAFTLDAADIVPITSNNNPDYNRFVSPNWIQTPMPNNSYMCLWKIAVPVTSDAASQKYRYIWIQGQQQGTLASQQALTPLNLNLGNLTLFAPEFVFVARVIIRFTSNNWSVTQIDKLTGSRALTVSSTGGFLSTVTTDSTLTGNGTAGDPLSVNVGILAAGREHADNAAALLANLSVGDFYRTGDIVKVVHL
jgi:hypothetical protein